MFTRKQIRNFTIATRYDVRDFVSYVVNELNCNFNPDDDFSEYINVTNEMRTFDDETSDYLNKISDDCFNLVGDEYYSICIDELNKNM